MVDALASTLPLYTASLVLMFPAGLVATLAYRGPRRLELISTVLVFVPCRVRIFSLRGSKMRSPS